MIGLVLAAAVAVSDPTGLDPVRFSNIRFDTGHNWSVVQPSPRMVLQPTNAMILTHARITIEPATPFSGTLEQGLEAAWAAALAGRATREDPVRYEPREIEVGGVVSFMSASVAPAGGLYVIAVKAGPKLTTIVLNADNQLAQQLCAMFLGPLLMSLEVVPDEAPPPGASAGPSAPGPDPSDSFDWDGPDEFRYGIYDHFCVQPNDEFGELVRTAKGFVGAVQPRNVTYADALTTAKKVLAVPAAREQYDAANQLASKEHPGSYTAGAAMRALQGDPFGALAQLLAGIDAAPDDPDVLFNMASVLAEVGMPNESLAVLGRLKATGKSPAMAAGLSAAGATAYLTGYDEMLRGNLEDAKTSLKQAISRDPFLNEARRVLSLIQAHEGAGAAGAKTYLGGMWRFQPRKQLLCGASIEDSERSGVDDMFDTSKGKLGKLVEFRHPRSADDLPKFFQMLGDLGTSYGAFVQAQAQRGIQVSATLPMGLGLDATPYDAWADKMSMLIESLDESEPLILKLQADMEASERDVQAAVGRAAPKLTKSAMALALSRGPNNLCPEIKSMTNQALAEVRPFVVHWETMQRRYAKALYKMGTGLNAHIGNAKWHAFNDASLRTGLAGHSLGLIADMLNVYSATAAGGSIPECFASDDAEPGLYVEPDEGPTCPDGMRNMAFKYAFELKRPGGRAGPKVGLQVDCEKFTVDIEWDLVQVDGALVEFGLGGFGQVEMYRSGEWSLFMGPKVSGAIGGSGGSFKDGIWVKAQANGTITELGGKVAADASMGASGHTLNAPVDEMVFNLLPEPPKPKRGPAMRSYRGAIE